MTVEFHFSPNPARAEAVFFGRREDADGCASALTRFERLKPEGAEWHSDLVLSERWERRVYCTVEFAAFFRSRRDAAAPVGIKFTVEKDLRHSASYRIAFAAGWLVRHERGDLKKWTREDLAEDLERAA